MFGLRQLCKLNSKSFRRNSRYASDREVWGRWGMLNVCDSVLWPACTSLCIVLARSLMFAPIEVPDLSNCRAMMYLFSFSNNSQKFTICKANSKLNLTIIFSVSFLIFKYSNQHIFKLPLSHCSLFDSFFKFFSFENTLNENSWCMNIIRV